jgi:dimeric dUTPase (all-alpha-NTP-PPase superfamily)
LTFEGPLGLLLRHHEYEVKIGDVSDEVKHIKERFNSYCTVFYSVNDFLWKNSKNNIVFLFY